VGQDHGVRESESGTNSSRFLDLSLRNYSLPATVRSQYGLEPIMTEVVEFTLNVKPGHYADVLELYSSFAHTYIEVNPSLLSILVVGDEGSGIVRGIGVYGTQDEAAAINSDAFFGAFMDSIEPLIEGSPNRVLLDLVHAWQR